jgi:hypothetical protein
VVWIVLKEASRNNPLLIDIPSEFRNLCEILFSPRQLQ